MRTLVVHLGPKSGGWGCSVSSPDEPWPWGGVAWPLPSGREAYYWAYHFARRGFRRYLFRNGVRA